MYYNLITILISLSSLRLGTTKYFKKVIQQIFDLEQSILIIGQPELFPLDASVYLSSINDTRMKLLEEANQLIVQIEKRSDLHRIFQKLKPTSAIIFVIEADLVFRIYSLSEKNKLFKVRLMSKTGEIFDRNGKTSYKNDQKFLMFSHQNRLKVAYLIDPPFVTDELEELPGIMTSLVELAAEKSNLILDYCQNCSVFQKELIDYGTISQLTDAVIKGIFDIATGHLLMNSTTEASFDFGPVLYNDALYFAGPKPQKLKSYKKLLLVFETLLWIIILFGVLLMTFIYYFFALIEDFSKTHFLWILIDVFSMTIGTSCTKPPNLISFKILLFSYLIVFLSMDAIYLGNLSKIFATASYDIKLDNLVSATASCKTYIYDWRMEKLTLLTYVTRDQPFARKRLRISPGSQIDFLRRTAAQRHNGTILFKSIFEAHPTLSSQLDFFSPHTLYITLPVSFYLRKFSPYRDLILFWSQEIVERGFVVKWFKDFAWKNTNRKPSLEDEEKIIVLKLAHFEEIFRTLLVGYLVALVVLCLEMVYRKLEVIGVVQKVDDFVWFLILLYKPPNVPMHKTTRNEWSL